MSTLRSVRGTVHHNVVSGACIRFGQLFIATLADDNNHRRRLVASLSGEIELTGRSQRELAVFATKLLDFIHVRSLPRLTLRISPSRGEHMASVLGYKAEAVLQLLPIPIDTVLSSAVSAIVQRGDVVIPGSDNRRLGAMAARFQRHAIETAVYAERQSRLRQGMAA